MRYQLQKTRLARGFDTHDQISKKIGISRASYTHIELGTRNPSLGVALKIAEVLDTTVDDIFLPEDVTSSTKNENSQRDANIA